MSSDSLPCSPWLVVRPTITTGMAGGGTGDAYWQKGQQDMASLIDRTVKDQEKAQQVKSIVNDIVAELKAGREQDRAGHRRLYELNANYAATPEEFTQGPG